MNKLTTIFSAFILALGFAGAAAAAEEQEGGQPPSAAQQSGQTGQDAQSGAQGANAELQAALRKCDQMTSTEKQQCIDDAMRKHGQM